MNKLYEQAQFGTLPDDFRDWALCDANGWTVAHEAARFGTLPDDFDQWELVDDYKGRTVAHVAARWGCLPLDFSHWDLSDRTGRPVAQEAALWG